MKLAHFTKMETLKCHILDKQQLRASKLRGVNDPFETRWANGSFHYARIGSGPNITNVPEQIKNNYRSTYDQAQDSIRIICFSNYAHSQKNNDIPEPHLNLKMWHNYGENHKGACIIFNEKIINDAQITQKSTYASGANVDYAIHPPAKSFKTPYTTGCDINEDIRNTLKDTTNILYHKRLEWRDELEYRIIFYEIDIKKEIYIPITDAINSIVFGANACEHCINEIQSTNPEIPLYKIFLDDDNITDELIQPIT